MGCCCKPPYQLGGRLYIYSGILSTGDNLWCWPSSPPCCFPCVASATTRYHKTSTTARHTSVRKQSVMNFYELSPKLLVHIFFVDGEPDEWQRMATIAAFMRADPCSGKKLYNGCDELRTSWRLGVWLWRLFNTVGLPPCLLKDIVHNDDFGIKDVYPLFCVGKGLGGAPGAPVGQYFVAVQVNVHEEVAGQIQYDFILFWHDGSRTADELFTPGYVELKVEHLQSATTPQFTPSGATFYGGYILQGLRVRTMLDNVDSFEQSCARHNRTPLRPPLEAEKCGIQNWFYNCSNEHMLASFHNLHGRKICRRTWCSVTDILHFGNNKPTAVWVYRGTRYLPIGPVATRCFFHRRRANGKWNEWGVATDPNGLCDVMT